MDQRLGLRELELPDELVDELPDFAVGLDDEESDVLLEEVPEASLPAEVPEGSLLPGEEESDELVGVDEESEDSSLDFFLAPLVSARESLR